MQTGRAKAQECTMAVWEKFALAERRRAGRGRRAMESTDRRRHRDRFRMTGRLGQENVECCRDNQRRGNRDKQVASFATSLEAGVVMMQRSRGARRKRGEREHQQPC